MKDENIMKGFAMIVGFLGAVIYVLVVWALVSVLI